MTTAILFGSFGFLLILGVPIMVSLTLSAIVAILFKGGLPYWWFRRGYLAVLTPFPDCVPFFMLAGALMNKGGITRRIINAADALTGHLRGSRACKRSGSMILVAYLGPQLQTRRL